jgi:hypothetical protein
LSPWRGKATLGVLAREPGPGPGGAGEGETAQIAAQEKEGLTVAQFAALQ